MIAETLDSVRNLRAARDRLVERVVERHFDPRWGSVYWLEREREIGIDARRDLRSFDDLRILGPMPAEALARRSVWDFVPRSLREDLASLVLAETGGTLGRPRRTVFHRDDFHAAFVAPMTAAVEASGLLPLGARWLFVGPSGPHAIGKAAREVCRALGAPDPFAVDFDPRWYKAQAEGSIGRKLYMRHVIEQALAILDAEPVEVIFSTPPVVAELGSRLGEEARRRISAIHLGGLPARGAADALERFFPGATVLSGYGNSLFGVCPQVEAGDLRSPVYHPHGERLQVEIVPLSAPRTDPPPEQVPHGERGRVVVSRLDESCLIPRLVERDTAVRLPGRPDLAARGFARDALGDPCPADDVPPERMGIY
jgi:hypothetical protein